MDHYIVLEMYDHPAAITDLAYGRTTTTYQAEVT
jgi:hypothetical protein